MKEAQKCEKSRVKYTISHNFVIDGGNFIAQLSHLWQIGIWTQQN